MNLADSNSLQSAGYFRALWAAQLPQICSFLQLKRTACCLVMRVIFSRLHAVLVDVEYSEQELHFSCLSSLKDFPQVKLCSFVTIYKTHLSSCQKFMEGEESEPPGSKERWLCAEPCLGLLRDESCGSSRGRHELWGVFYNILPQFVLLRGTK